VMGLLSMLGSSSILFFIIRAKLYKKLHTRVILYLCISDLFQGMEGASSFGWINTKPFDYEPWCTFQSLMFEYGDCASAIASAVIATLVFGNVNSFKFIKCMGTPGPIFERISLAFIFGCPLLFVFCGFMRQVVTGDPFYTPVGFDSWCWISESFPVERMMLHYTWIFVVFFFTLLSSMSI